MVLAAIVTEAKPLALVVAVTFDRVPLAPEVGTAKFTTAPGITLPY